MSIRTPFTLPAVGPHARPTHRTEPPAYAELMSRSCFSFLTAASAPEELVGEAGRLAYQALALTDECSLAGAVRAHVAAKEHGLPLILGSQFAIEGLGRLVVHAMDRTGYGELCALITRARARAGKGRYHACLEDLASGLPGCRLLWRVHCPITDASAAALTVLRDAFQDRFGLAYARLLNSDDALQWEAALDWSERLVAPLIAVGDVLMHVRGRRPLLDVLTAIQANTTVAKLGADLQPNGERHLRSRQRLLQLYPAECLQASVDWAAQCHFCLDSLRYEYPEELVPPGATPASHLR